MRKKYTYAENYNVAIRQPALKQRNSHRRIERQREKQTHR